VARPKNDINARKGKSEHYNRGYNFIRCHF
jgi:hypothetical protein